MYKTVCDSIRLQLFNSHACLNLTKTFDGRQKWYMGEVRGWGGAIEWRTRFSVGQQHAWRNIRGLLKRKTNGRKQFSL